MSKYKMLEHILDSIANESPENYKQRYKDSSNGQNEEKMKQIRSLSYIHLLLKAKFNVLNFNEREQLITDGANDGGIDAYYIDKENRDIYFIQSKYRTNESNYTRKSITIDEISKMDINRIASGEEQDEAGNSYNGKIKGLIRELQNIEQISRYDYKIIILANIDNKLKKSIDQILPFPYEIYDHKKAYEELVFPILRGTCHQATDITVNLSLSSKNNYTMDYEVESKEFSTNVQLFFIPTIEIAKLMSKHKNSILEYNPRSYLGLAKNPVNNAIKNQIIDKEDNMFSLFNNGITILSDDTEFSTRTGKKGIGQLYLKNPQIINGGQTAYTLSTIYEDNGIDNSVFEKKEILVKVITFDESIDSDSTKLELIENLSQATNNQSKIVEADRKSNLEVQIKLQKYLFDTFGYCYHRKTGEFSQGLSRKYISKDNIIERDILIRIAYSINGEVAMARRSGTDTLFTDKRFDRFLNVELTDSDFDKIFYSYLVHKVLVDIEKNPIDKEDKYSMKLYGNALRYGKFAVVYLVSKIINEKMIKEQLDLTTIKEYTDFVLGQWVNFEKEQMYKDSNKDYFIKNEKDGVYETNFDNYYKGRTINSDLEKYSFSVLQ